MFQAMQDIVARTQYTNNPQPHTDKASALFDWIGLGVFTGHRLSELGQSTLPKVSTAQGFDPLPTNSHMPPAWRGKPKAFVRDDFSFYDASLHQLDHDQLQAAPSSAEYVHIRWRFDKSKFNFITKQYQRQHKTAPSQAGR
jgi:hypothetical protein